MKKNITVNGKNYVDLKGRNIILRGINMVCKDKDKNFLGNYSLEDFYYLKDLGFNIVRLGLFWKAIEPKPFEYDMEYLNEIEKYIQYAKKAGINVFLDMHQDLYADSFSDGAPDWATLTEGCEHVETNLWSESYLLSGAVQNAFDNFFDNAKTISSHGVLDHYKAMWEVVIKRFYRYENVIGYDFMNEPFMGKSVNDLLGSIMMTLGKFKYPSGEVDIHDIQDLWLNPDRKSELLELLGNIDVFKSITKNSEAISQLFETTKLQHFFEEMTKLARNYDKEGIIFLETNYFSNMGMKSGVKKTDLLNCFAPHGYDILVDTELYELYDLSRVEHIFKTHKQVADEQNIPMIVGEWGCFPDAKESHLRQAKGIMNLFETLQVSDTYFDFNHLHGNRIEEVLKKPYPYATPGEIDKYHYDYEQRELYVEYSNLTDSSEVVVFVPDFEEGFTLTGVNDYCLVPIENTTSAHLIFKTNCKKIKFSLKVED